MFYVGLHHPSDAHRFDRAFISVNAIRRRKKAIGAKRWIMDSGAFTELSTHGSYRHSVEEYAEVILRWADDPALVAVVAQDYMCEPFILAKTGLTIEQHQWLTVERYDALNALVGHRVYVMPVLQGYAPQEYVQHLRMYGARIRPDAYVGVGSVCKRNINVESVKRVLLGVKRVAPDLRLHGFGLKITALADPVIQACLESADSMSWSYAARRAKRDANDWREAKTFVERIEASQIEYRDAADNN
jgi:hypothetical protein